MNVNEHGKIIYNESILSGKVHESLEDPISQFFYDVSDLISPYLYKVGITPNIVTFSRLLLIIVAFFYLFKVGNYKMVAVLYTLAYFGDCLDGHLARKYNLDSTAGDCFDHISDVLTIIVSLYFIISNLDKEFDWIILAIIIMMFLNLTHIACEERYLDYTGMHRQSDSLNIVQILCPRSLIEDDELENFTEFVKFFGYGTYTLFIAIVLWNFDHIAIKK